MKRPELTRALTPEEFQNTYFLKEELQAFAKSCGISAGGSKAELNERILQLLRGESVQNSRKERVRRNVREDSLSLDSIIEENIVCSQRHRSFFQSVIGKRFSFNVEFQDWLKAHAGLTYQDAVDAWHMIQEQKKHTRTVIGSQFEYNTYIRAFFADNPGRSLQEAIQCWNYRKAIPGAHEYQKEDLRCLKEKESR